MNLIPFWNSLDSVRRVHSDLEFASIIFFAFLAFFDVLSHRAEGKKRERTFGTIGLYFFGVAIFCELLAYPYGQRNDTLSESVIGSLDQKAEHARNAADTALDNARKADELASAANEKAFKADGSATRANKAARTALHEAINAAPRSWRLYGTDQKKFVDSLKLFAGQDIDITFCSYNLPNAPFGTDKEVTSLAMQLRSLLAYDAHWNAPPPRGDAEDCGGGGVWVSIDPNASERTRNAANELQMHLAKLGLSGTRVMNGIRPRTTEYPKTYWDNDVLKTIPPLGKDTIILSVNPHP